MKSYTCVVSGSQALETKMCYSKQIVQGYLKEMLDTNDEIPLIIHEREPTCITAFAVRVLGVQVWCYFRIPLRIPILKAAFALYLLLN